MERLNEILCDVFRIEKNDLKEELTMDDIQSWDSLTHMDLITSLEDGLEIQFTMDDIMIMKDIKTIRSIVSQKLI